MAHLTPASPPPPRPPHYWDVASLPVKTSCCSSVCLQTSSCLEFLRFVRLQNEILEKAKTKRQIWGRSLHLQKQNEVQVCTSPRAPDAYPAVPNSFLAKGIMSYLTLHLTPLFWSRGNWYSFNTLDTSPVSPARIFRVLAAPSPTLLTAHRAKTLVQVWGQFKERGKRWLSWERDKNKVACGSVQKCRFVFWEGEKFPLSN